MLFVIKLLGVRDREPRAPAELFRKLDIARIERFARGRANEGQRPIRTRLKRDRDDDLRAVAQPPHELRVGRRASVELDLFVVHDRHEKREARLRDAHGRMHAVLAIVEERRSHRLEHRFEAFVAVRSYGNVEPVGFLVEEIEETQVGERFDRDPRDVEQRVFENQGLVEHFAGSNEQFEAIARSLVATCDGRFDPESGRRYVRLRGFAALRSRESNAHIKRLLLLDAGHGHGLNGGSPVRKRLSGGERGGYSRSHRCFISLRIPTMHRS